ncbi:MAG: hypothetical protein LBJ43_02860 [Propionibacteriaceae bacterium]|nr:hypothetical protein [Propionibacteriaceae bacterium]
MSDTNTDTAKATIRRATLSSRAVTAATIRQQRDMLRCVDVAVIARGVHDAASHHERTPSSATVPETLAGRTSILTQVSQQQNNRPNPTNQPTPTQNPSNQQQNNNPINTHTPTTLNPNNQTATVTHTTQNPSSSSSEQNLQNPCFANSYYPANTNIAHPDTSDLSEVLDEQKLLAGMIVAVYLSYGTEPSTLDIVNLFNDLGATLLAPVIVDPLSGLAMPAPAWAWHRGETMQTRSGIAQPVGEAFGPELLTLADLIIIPGLAGGRDGSRLGVGGGWYDRALHYARPDTLRLLLLNENEVYDTVPHIAHDLRVDALITEVGLTLTKP